MKIVVIDGQGGQLGARLVASSKERLPQADVIGIGTNSIAARAMAKAGARAASGENSVIVACRTADVILGPVGIVIADSMLGEVTPKMAVAVGQANAVRILLPMNRCENLIAGIGTVPMQTLIDDAIAKLLQIAGCP